MVFPPFCLFSSHHLPPPPFSHPALSLRLCSVSHFLTAATRWLLHLCDPQKRNSYLLWSNNDNHNVFRKEGIGEIVIA